MAQYIDKSALVAEIKRRMNYWHFKPGLIKASYAEEEDRDILSFLNTLEVKEVDLEKEYKDFVEEDSVYNKLVNSIVGKAIARHFYELGLKAQKEDSYDKRRRNNQCST